MCFFDCRQERPFLHTGFHHVAHLQCVGVANNASIDQCDAVSARQQHVGVKTFGAQRKLFDAMFLTVHLLLNQWRHAQGESVEAKLLLGQQLTHVACDSCREPVETGFLSGFHQ